MKRALVVIVLGLAVSVGIAQLDAEHVNTIGSVWAAVFKVLAISALAATAVTAIARRRG